MVNFAQFEVSWSLSPSLAVWNYLVGVSMSFGDTLTFVNSFDNFNERAFFACMAFVIV